MSGPTARCTMVTTSDGLIVEGGYFNSDWTVRSAETRQVLCVIPHTWANGALDALDLFRLEQGQLESELNVALDQMHGASEMQS